MTLTTNGSYHYVIASRKYHTRKRISARAIVTSRGIVVLSSLPTTLYSLHPTNKRTTKQINFVAKLSENFVSVCVRVPSNLFLFTIETSTANPSHAPLVHDTYDGETVRTVLCIYTVLLFFIIYCLRNRCGFNLLLKTFFRNRNSIAVTSRAVNIVSVQ